MSLDSNVTAAVKVKIDNTDVLVLSDSSSATWFEEIIVILHGKSLSYIIDRSFIYVSPEKKAAMDLYYDGKPPSGKSASSDKGILPGTVSEVIFSDWLRLHQILFSACDAKYKGIYLLFPARYMYKPGHGLTEHILVGLRSLTRLKSSKSGSTSFQ